MFFISKNSWFQLLRTLPLTFYLYVFEAGCKLVSLIRVAFPTVLLMSKRLRYLLRMCSTWLKSCSATYIGVSTSGNNSFTFPQTYGKRSLHLMQNPKTLPSVLIKYGTGFIIALEVDEKFLDVESHSLMLVSGKKAHHQVTFQSNFRRYIHNRKTF